MADIVAGLQRGSWAGSGDTLDKKFGTYLRRKMLDAFYNRIGVDQWLDTDGIPANSGDKILFKRFVKKALATTAITAGYNATPTARSVQTIEASLSRYGNAEDIGKEVLQTAVANLPEDIMQMFGIEAAETVERLVFTNIAPIQDNALARIDSLPANWTLDTTCTTASTSTNAFKIRTSAPNYKGKTTALYWKNSSVTFMSGANAGVTRKVATHLTATAAFTVTTAFEYAPAAGDIILLSRNAGHTTATAAQQLLAKATAAGGGDLRTARMLLEKFGAIPFQGSFDNLKNAAPEAPRGDYVALVTPEQYLDLLGDTVFQTAAQQGDTWKNKLAGYQIVRFMGMLIHSMGMAFRTTIPVAGTAEGTTHSSTGAGHIATCLGMHAAAMVKPEGYGGRGKAGIKTYIKRPGPQDTSQSNDAFIRLGWDAYFGQRVLNAAWGINLCTVASV